MIVDVHTHLNNYHEDRVVSIDGQHGDNHVA